MKRKLFFFVLIALFGFTTIQTNHHPSTILSSFGDLYSTGMHPMLYIHQSQYLAFLNVNSIDIYDDNGLVKKSYDNIRNDCMYSHTGSGQIFGISDDVDRNKNINKLSIYDIITGANYYREFDRLNYLGGFLYPCLPPVIIESWRNGNEYTLRAFDMKTSLVLWEKTYNKPTSVLGCDDVVFIKSSSFEETQQEYITSIIDPFTGDTLQTFNQDLRLWYENNNFVILYQELKDFDEIRFIVINRANWQIITDFTQSNTIIINAKQDFIKVVYKDIYQDSKPKTMFMLEWINQFGITWKKQEVILDRFVKPVGRTFPKIVVVGDYIGYINNELIFQIICMNDNKVEYEEYGVSPNVTSFCDKIWFHDMSMDKTKWIEKFLDPCDPSKQWSIELPIEH